MQYRSEVIWLSVFLLLFTLEKTNGRLLVKRKASPFFGFLFPRPYRPQRPPIQYIVEEYESPKIVIRPIRPHSGRSYKFHKSHLHKHFPEHPNVDVHNQHHVKNVHHHIEKPHIHKEVHPPPYHVYPAIKDVHIEYDNPYVIEVKPIRPFSKEFGIPYEAFPPVKQHILDDFVPSQPIHDEFHFETNSEKPYKTRNKLVLGPESEYNIIKFDSKELQHPPEYYKRIMSNAIYRLDYPKSRIIGIKNFQDQISDDLIPAGIYGLDEETINLIKKAAKEFGKTR